MSKVGIITFHHNSNYGSMLQALALQEAIRKNGFETEFIDFVPQLKKTIYELLKIRIKRFPIYLLEYKKYYTLYKNRKNIVQKNNAFEDFYKKHLQVSHNTYHSMEEIKKNPPLYDGYIVGSDQTWNPYASNNPDAFYLNFVSKNKLRGSYAPSIAVSKLNLKQSERLKRLTQNIEYLSCREKHGSELLKKLTGRNVETVLDPTLLLSSSDWMKFSSANFESKPYIMQYFLGENKQHREFVKKLSIKTGWEIISIPTAYMDFNDSICKQYICGPDEFISLIKNASFLCTDSFHGTAFSINFNVSFFSFYKFSENSKQSENSRLIELLSIFGLKDRIIVNSNIIPEKNKLTIDFKMVNLKLSKLKNISIDYLKSMLNDINKEKEVQKFKQSYIQFDFENECYSCEACLAVCPVQAITASANDDGCFVPIVNTNICINCGKCVKVCTKINEKKPGPVSALCESYIAYNKNIESRMSSSSGGIFILLAKEILKCGGVISGCIFDKKCNTKHIVSSKNENVIKMIGSKYIHSSMNISYQLIKEKLNSNKIVLFSGVPCQIAAMKNVFGNNENIYYVAVICHGTISRKLWKLYVKEEEEINGKILYCNMRDKASGWENYGLKFLYFNKKEHISYRKTNGYLLKCYTDGLLERERCLNCNYKGDQIKSDIILGDGWNLNKYYPGIDDGKGVSMILCLTDKGKILLNRIASDLLIKPCNKDFLCQNNPRILTPEVRHIALKSIRKEIKDSHNLIHTILKKYAVMNLFLRLSLKIKKYYMKRIKNNDICN